MSRSIRHSLLNKSEEQLQVLIGDHGSDPTGLAAAQVLQDMRSKKVSEQLEQLSNAVLRPAWKTLSFWIVLATFFVASAALLRDVVDWTIFGFDRPVSMSQQPAPESKEQAPRLSPAAASDASRTQPVSPQSAPLAPAKP